MKNKYGIIFLVVFLTGIFFSHANAQNQPFKGYFYEEKEKVELHLNLYEATLTVPGMSFLGKVNGYMQGDIYGIWMLTKFKISGKTATLRFSNDLGSDSQTVKLTLQNDSTIIYEAKEGNRIKRVHNRRLIKIPDKLFFTKVN